MPRAKSASSPASNARAPEPALDQRVHAERGDVPLVEHDGMPEGYRLLIIGVRTQQLEELGRTFTSAAEPSDAGFPVDHRLTRPIHAKILPAADDSTSPWRRPRCSRPAMRPVFVPPGRRRRGMPGDAPRVRSPGPLAARDARTGSLVTSCRSPLHGTARAVRGPSEAPRGHERVPQGPVAGRPPRGGRGTARGQESAPWNGADSWRVVGATRSLRRRWAGEESGRRTASTPGRLGLATRSLRRRWAGEDVCAAERGGHPGGWLGARRSRRRPGA